MSRRGDREDLDVEELNVAAWGNPADAWNRPHVDPPPFTPVHGPPSGPPERYDEEWGTTAGGASAGSPLGQRDRSWFWRHTDHVVAAVGGVGLLISVVAVAAGSGGDPAATPTAPPTTVAPSTTQGRPVTTAAPSTTEAPDSSGAVGGGGDGDGNEDDTDYRFAVTEAPDGYEPLAADVVDPNRDGILPGPPMLFAADGTSWQTGPWLLVSVSQQYGPPVAFPFERPPLPFTLGEVDAELGTSHDGVEVTAFERDGQSVSIAARGLDPLMTAAVASEISLSANGVVVPEAVLPDGLRARSDIDIRAWEWQWTAGVRATVSYGNNVDGWMTINVRQHDTAPDLFSAAPYVLSDVRYAVVGNGTGIAGTYAPSYGSDVSYVIWQLADREYVATGTGTTLAELIAVARSIVQPGDPGWRSALWDDVRNAARACCNEPDEPSDTPTPSAVATASSEDRWQIDAWTRDGVVRWDGSVRNDQDFIALETPVGAPLLRVASRPRWPGMPDEFPAAAVALVDRSMLGSILRLTTTGSEPQTIEMMLQPLDEGSLASYLAGAVVLPWTEGGFVAELVSPSGQTIAVQTDADLR